MADQLLFEMRRPVDDAARMAAISTGDLVAATLESARAIGREVKGDRYRGASIALGRLEEQGLVTERERGQMEELLDALRQTEGKRNIPGAVSRQVRDVHLALLADPRSSATALAIASGVHSLMAPRTKGGDDDAPQVVYLTTNEGVGIGGFLGGIVGGLVGGFAGVSVGFCIGATIGAGCSEGD